MPTRKDIYNNMYNVYTYIEDLDIGSGETKRLNCPACNSYKTFTVTNNMGSLVWNCYKASCNVKGSSRVHMTVDEIRDIKKVPQLVSFFCFEYHVSHLQIDVLLCYHVQSKMPCSSSTIENPCCLLQKMFCRNYIQDNLICVYLHSLHLTV